MAIFHSILLNFLKDAAKKSDVIAAAIEGFSQRARFATTDRRSMTSMERRV